MKYRTKQSLAFARAHEILKLRGKKYSLREVASLSHSLIREADFSVLDTSASKLHPEETVLDPC